MDAESYYPNDIVNNDYSAAVSKSKSFFVLWLVELWERFGYYGVQAILTLYFVQHLGYSQNDSFYIFGSFSAFVYGFTWIGGQLGDRYLGAKRTMLLGAIVLASSYAGMALATKATIFYALSGIIIGNALFKANPSSLISKLYGQGDPKLDSAMTMYYMGVNLGSMLSMSLTPFIAEYLGWHVAFAFCSFGLVLGIGNYWVMRHLLKGVYTEAGAKPLSLKRLSLVITGGVLMFLAIANLLQYTVICNWIIYTVITIAFVYFLYLAFSFDVYTRQRMLVALALITLGVVFFVLYNQMPTSLTFFALNNIDNHVMGFDIPPASYQVLNPVFIVIMSPILAWVYTKSPATHVTKFCVGVSLCAAAFLVLDLPQFTAQNGIASPLWMVLSYFLQSTGELFVSGLGLAMVAELCPSSMSGFVMGIWWLTSMVAGPIGAWVGSLTAPDVKGEKLSATASMSIYAHVFTQIGLVTACVALLMWVLRPMLNRVIQKTKSSYGL